jgi:hypothetical protein
MTGALENGPQFSSMRWPADDTGALHTGEYESDRLLRQVGLVLSPFLALLRNRLRLVARHGPRSQRSAATQLTLSAIETG